MRLRTTFFGVLILIALVLSGTVYVGFTLHKNDVRAQERQAVEQTATVVADRLDTWVETTATTVELWATNLNASADAPSQANSLETFLDRTAFDSASVYTAEGSLASLADPDLFLREQAGAPLRTRVDVSDVNHSNEAFIQRALTGETYVSDVGQSLTGAYVIRIAAPIRDAEGTVTGVFSGSFEIETETLFGELTAVGRDGEYVSITFDDRTVLGESYDLKNPISSDVTVSETGWVVTITRPRTMIADQLQVATAMQVGGVVVALLSIALVGLWISRTTFERIRTLREALVDLETGDYRTDLDLGSIREWREISDRFNAVSGMLEQRDSQLRVLNRVLRHNLRNDMNVVTSHAERILAEEDVSDDVKADVEKIHTTAHRLLSTSEHARTLYDDLLAKPKQAVEPVDVVPIVESRIATLASQFPEATIESAVPSTARGLDSKTLPIVVEELLRNALVHNDLPEARRHVSVSVSRKGTSHGDVDAPGEVRIDIEDNGPGIPMVEEALLTEQLEETSIDHGSGLGVWLVNWLLDQIGGTVTVRTGVDRGTMVSIHVPAPESPPDSVGDTGDAGGDSDDWDDSGHGTDGGGSDAPGDPSDRVGEDTPDGADDVET